MGNENERKRDPADNRERDQGHPFDDAKTGGGETTVGLTGDTGGGAGGMGAGTNGAIGGSAAFLAGEDEQAGGPSRSQQPSQPTAGQGGGSPQSENAQAQQNHTFGGQTGSGTSTLNAGVGTSLGASGAGSPGSDEPAGSMFGSGEGASQEGSRSTTSEDRSQDASGSLANSESGGDTREQSTSRSGSPENLQDGDFIASKAQDSEVDPQQAGFAEQGRGAPEGSSDIERPGSSSDIEGSSERSR